MSNQSRIADLARLAENSEWVADNTSIHPSAGEKLREDAARYRKQADTIRKEAVAAQEPRRWERRR